MSDSDRGDRGALVALAIVAIAVLIIFFFDWLGEPANQMVGQPASDYIKANQNGDVARSVASSNYNPWLDSYAQWAMAVLSIVATGVSVWAVGLLRKTLAETQKATKAAVESNAVAREIGQAQVRAYLNCVGGGFRIYKDGVLFSLVFKNNGQSPCRHVHVFTEVTYQFRIISPGSSVQDFDFKTLPPQESTCESIAAGGEGEISIAATFGRNIKPSEFKDIYSGELEFELDCRIVWQDVFESEQTLFAHLKKGEMTHSEYDGRGTTRIGKMIVFSEGYSGHWD